MEPSWHQNRFKNHSQLQKAIFIKTWFFPKKKHDFEGSGGRSWEPKSIKNPSKNVINLGRHLDIDFWQILVDFLSQVGEENPPKVDPKGCLKTSIFKGPQIGGLADWPRSRAGGFGGEGVLIGI